MSVKVMNLVWERAPYEGNTLLTMLALADWSDDEGQSWPSNARLAKKSRQSERNVQRCCRQMESDGFLAVTKRHEQTNSYRLNLEKLKQFEGDKLSPPLGDRISMNGVTGPVKNLPAVSPNTPITTSEPSRTKGGEPPAKKAGLPQAQKDTWDLRRWREALDRSVPHAGDPYWFTDGTEREELNLNRYRSAAFDAGITLERLQELLVPFGDPLAKKLMQEVHA